MKLSIIEEREVIGSERRNWEQRGRNQKRQRESKERSRGGEREDRGGRMGIRKEGGEEKGGRGGEEKKERGKGSEERERAAHIIRKRASSKQFDLHFWPPDLGENKPILFKSLSLVSLFL